MLKGIIKQLIVFMAVMGFVISTVDFIFIYDIKRNLPVEKPRQVLCVVDLWKLSTDKVLHLASMDDKEMDKTNVVNSIDTYIREVSNILKNPQEFGCDIIAVKGSLLGNVIDITALVKKKVAQQMEIQAQKTP